MDVVWEDLVAGLIYRGPLSNRDQDMVGIDAAWAQLDRAGAGEETALELFYKIALGSKIFVQPDLQYILSPSDIYPNAIAVGLRFQMSL